MANLLPPDAKKTVRTEYWLRVLTVWCVLIGFAMVVVILLKIPTFVYLQLQTKAFSAESATASDRSAAFAEAQEAVEDANALSRVLIDTAEETSLITVQKTIDTIAGSGIKINTFSFEKAEGVLTAVTIAGVAETRLALAKFSDDIEAHEWFASADVPISNLAKDRDIAFNIEIVTTFE